MLAERRQQPVGACRLAGSIDKPGERRGKLHAAIMGATPRHVTRLGKPIRFTPLPPFRRERSEAKHMRLLVGRFERASGAST